MKRAMTILLAISMSIPGIGQVEVGKAKQTIMGKGKILGQDVSELGLDNFSLNFNLYKYAQDEGGSSNVALSAKVGVSASLGGVTEDLVQEITNEAYTYWVDQWKKRGVTITNQSKDNIEASTNFSKAKKKGKMANIMNGGVWNNDQQKGQHTMMAWPNGVNIPSSGEGMTYKGGNAAHYGPGYGGEWTSFAATIDFIEMKTAKLGSTASVKSIPRLTLSGGHNVSIWEKNKIGGYLGSISCEGIEDFYTEVTDDKDIEVLNSKRVIQTYHIDMPKFKSNVMEMLKASIDASFTDWDEVKAKNQ